MKIEFSNNKAHALLEVEALVQEMLQNQIISHEQFGSILMAITAAVENTGPGMNTLEYSIEDHFVDFSISNCLLPSFDNQLLDEDTQDSADLDLALICKLADEVKFSDETDLLQLRFEIVSMQQKIHTQRANVLSSARVQSKATTQFNNNF